MHRYETFTRFADFATFTKDQALRFKSNLMEQKNARTGEPFSMSTVFHTLTPLQKFLKWLAAQKGYKTKINTTDIAYLNLSDKDERIARTQRDKPAPTLEQVLAAIKAMPADTVLERRDRAIMACLILTGARDGALISLRVRHVDIERRLILQDPDTVKTKKSKLIYSYFFPVGGDVETILQEWVHELKTVHLYGNDDPLFPKTAMSQADDYSFKSDGIERAFWSTAQPVRAIVRMAFTRAGMNYFNPHSFRKTLTRHGQKICKTPEQFKAWSQNFGHTSPLTTFTSYGNIPYEQQGDIIAGIGKGDEQDKFAEILGLLKGQQ